MRMTWARSASIVVAFAVLVGSAEAVAAITPTRPTLAAADAVVVNQLENPRWDKQISVYQTIETLAAHASEPAARARLDAIFDQLMKNRRAEASRIDLYFDA